MTSASTTTTTTTTTTLSSSSKQPNEVVFKDVNIREHARRHDGGGAVPEEGYLALGLGWAYEDAPAQHIDDYEAKRAAEGRATTRELDIIPMQERWRKLERTEERPTIELQASARRSAQEIEAIRRSRLYHNRGCHCKDGDCRTNACICFEKGDECFYKICKCRRGDCCNRLNPVKGADEESSSDELAMRATDARPSSPGPAEASGSPAASDARPPMLSRGGLAPPSGGADDDNDRGPLRRKPTPGGMLALPGRGGAVGGAVPGKSGDDDEEISDYSDEAPQVIVDRSDTPLVASRTMTVETAVPPAVVVTPVAAHGDDDSSSGSPKHKPLTSSGKEKKEHKKHSHKSKKSDGSSSKSKLSSSSSKDKVKAK